MSGVDHNVVIGDSRKINLPDESVHLVVTSPPYFDLKDYGHKGQIGFGQTSKEYLRDLKQVLSECFRVLKPGRYLCVNVGDVFIRAGKGYLHSVFPLHSHVIQICTSIGSRYMNSVIWRKAGTSNTSGGIVGSLSGSYPTPPNGRICSNHEHIAVFKKYGKQEPVDRESRLRSAMTKKEWVDRFSGHWEIPGDKTNEHPAPFPIEIPFRLISMFSVVGETVLDPFVGRGTTIAAAAMCGRRSIGCEINQEYAFKIPDYVKRWKEVDVKIENTGVQVNWDDIKEVMNIRRGGGNVTDLVFCGPLAKELLDKIPARREKRRQEYGYKWDNESGVPEYEGKKLLSDLFPDYLPYMTTASPSKVHGNCIIIGRTDGKATIIRITEGKNGKRSYETVEAEGRVKRAS